MSTQIIKISDGHYVVVDENLNILYEEIALSVDDTGREHDKLGRFGRVSRSGTPVGPVHVQHSPSLKPQHHEPPPTKPKKKKTDVEDHPDATKFANESHTKHLARTEKIRSIQDPLERMDAHMASYEQYEKDISDAGIVGTDTGYGYKKGYGPK